MKKQIVKTLFLIFFYTSLIAQHGVTMSGIVSDITTGEVLIGTNLLLYQDSISVNTEPFKGTSSNRYGFYAFTKLSKKKYFLVVRNIGYKTVTKEISITINSGKVELNIELLPNSIELGEVIVESKKNNNVNISTVKLSPKFLEMLPSLSGEVDIFKSLQLLPGVQTASEISNGLYIRGGSPDQTLTLVDGMVLYNPAHLGNFTSTFNSNAVQDIKLIKGAYPAEYGGRLSSVLDIKLKSGSKYKSKATIGIGSINSFIALEGPLNKNGTYLFSGRTMYYDSVVDLIDNGSSAPRYNFTDINSKLTYNLGGNNKLALSLFYSKDKLYNSSSNDFNYNINWQNSAFSINWLRILNSSALTRTTLSLMNYNFETNISENPNTVSGSNFYSNSNLTDLQFKSISEIRWNEQNVIKSGVELGYHLFDVLFSNYYSYALENSQREKDKYIDFSLFFQNESNFNEIFKMNIGMRASYFLGENQFQYEPRISFSFTPVYFLSFKTAVAKTYQSLHLLTRNDKSLPTDIWYPSNKYMKPSESWQYVFGIESNLDKNKYLITLEGYYRDMNHLYEFKNNATFDPFESFENQITEGVGEAYGIEAFINKRSGDFKGWIGYTYSWTKRKFDEINNGKIFYPRYDRRNDVSVALTYDGIKNFKIGISWVYSTGERITMPNGQYVFNDIAPNNSQNIYLNTSGRNGLELPPYHKMDLNLTYSFKLNSALIDTYLNIYNLYNQYNVFSYYITYKEKNGQMTPVLNQITLFPFLPTLGIKITF